MSKGPSRHLLVSLPNSITPSRDQSDALSSLKTTLQPTNHGDTTYAFAIPTFKIGTLDALVQQADELSKLSSDAEVVVGKVGDSLSALLEGDVEKVLQQKVVGDSMSSLQSGESSRMLGSRFEGSHRPRPSSDREQHEKCQVSLREQER
jgi:hypothetical protein